MTDMTLKTINRYLQQEIQSAKKLDAEGELSNELNKKRLIGYLCSVAIQGRKADIEERLERIERMLEDEKNQTA